MICELKSVNKISSVAIVGYRCFQNDDPNEQEHIKVREFDNFDAPECSPGIVDAVLEDQGRRYVFIFHGRFDVRDHKVADVPVSGVQ